MNSRPLRREETAMVLRGISQLRRRKAPKDVIEMLKTMLIEKHPDFVKYIVHAKNCHDYGEYLLAYVKTRQDIDSMDPFDIAILQAQFHMTEKEAMDALMQCNGDFVDAILYVDMERNRVK